MQFFFSKAVSSCGSYIGSGMLRWSWLKCSTALEAGYSSLVVHGLYPINLIVRISGILKGGATNLYLQTFAKAFMGKAV